MQGMFPREVTSGAARLTLTGREELLVEQHRGLMRYENGCIELRSEDGTLRITGEKLRFARYTKDEACILGQISSVAILPEGGKA